MPNQFEICCVCGDGTDRYIFIGSNGPLCLKCYDIAKLKEKKEPTAAQERAAIVAWLTGKISQHCIQFPEKINILQPIQVVQTLARGIENGEHWPTEEE